MEEGLGAELRGKQIKPANEEVSKLNQRMNAAEIGYIYPCRYEFSRCGILQVG